MRQLITEIEKHRLPQGYEITAADFKSGARIDARFGAVSKTDVGRKIWVRGHEVFMESPSQAKARKSKKNPRRRRSRKNCGCRHRRNGKRSSRRYGRK